MCAVTGGHGNAVVFPQPTAAPQTLLKGLRREHLLEPKLASVSKDSKGFTSQRGFFNKTFPTALALVAG